MNAERIPFKTFDIRLGSTVISPSYIQAFLILVLVFLLIYSFAHIRHMYIHWSFKPAISWLFMGIVLAFIIEGFFMLSGRTVFTELLGWKNAPQPILTALDSSRSKLVDVLGVTKDVPTSSASEPISSKTVLELYRDLDKDSATQVTDALCKVKR